MYNLLKIKNINRIFITVFVVFFINISYAQNVAISDVAHTAHASAMLDIFSTSKGLLLPNVNLSTNPISSPATGLLVWNTTAAGGYVVGYYFYNGSAWVKLGSGSYNFQNGLTESAGNIVKLGGSLTGNTTIIQEDYTFKIENNGSLNTIIDLTNSGDFLVRSNGVNSFFVRDDANVGIGTSSPLYRLHVAGTGDAIRKSAAFFNNTNPDYDGASSIYAMQAPDNESTKWGINHAKAAIKGCTFNGFSFTAGVAGYRYDDNRSQSAGVFGAASTEDAPKVWGALGFRGYHDGVLYNYAGYFNGDIAITRNVGVHGEYINFDTIIGESGYGFRQRGGTMEYKNKDANWTPLPAPPPSGSSTEWWYKPSGKFYIQPLSNDNIRVYDAGQDTGFYYNGYTNKIAGFFRTTSGLEGTSAVQGFSDVLNKKTFGYLGYNGTYAAFIKPGSSLTVKGAAVYGVVNDEDRVSIFGRTTGNASYSAIIGFSDTWIAGYYIAKDSNDYSARPALYGQLTTKKGKTGNQSAIRGYSEFTGTDNQGATIGGNFTSIGGTQDAYGVLAYASTSASSSTPIGLYAYTSQSLYAGTNYTESTVGPTGVIGYLPHSGRTGSNANMYQFGVFGHKEQNYSGSYYYDLRSGGVLGVSYRTDNSTILGWGTLGYKSSGNVDYGVYGSAAYASGGGKSSEPYNGIGLGAYGGLMGGWLHGNIYGLTVRGNRYALYADGDIVTNKQLAVVAKQDNQTIPLQANLSASSDIYLKGIGQLNNGKAQIQFDKAILPFISETEPIIITVTPMGNTQGVYLSDVGKNGFSVIENNQGKSNVQFSWIAIAVRKGYESNRLPSEIISNDFDKNLDNLMINENDTLMERKNGFWWDGSKLQFDQIKEDKANNKPVIQKENKRHAKLDTKPILPYKNK